MLLNMVHCFMLLSSGSDRWHGIKRNRKPDGYISDHYVLHKIQLWLFLNLSKIYLKVVNLTFLNLLGLRSNKQSIIIRWSIILIFINKFFMKLSNALILVLIITGTLSETVATTGKTKKTQKIPIMHLPKNRQKNYPSTNWALSLTRCLQSSRKPMINIRTIKHLQDLLDQNQQLILHLLHHSTIQNLHFHQLLSQLLSQFLNQLRNLFHSLLHNQLLKVNHLSKYLKTIREIVEI